MHIGRTCLRTVRVARTSVLRTPQRAYESTRRRIPFARYELPSPTWRPKPRPLPVWEPWSKASVAVLERLLAWMARNKPSITTVETLLRYMINERRVQPTTAHYEAMILANRDPDGSIGNVKAILADMEEHGLPTSGLVDNAVLEVLAVHPDSSLRLRTIQKMAREWIPLSTTALHSNIAALVREGQLELAQKEIQQAESSDKEVPIWLRTLLMHTVSESKDFETLMALFYELDDKQIELPRTTWLYLLDTAVEFGQLPVIDWIWSKHVEPMFITPSPESCVHVLKLAAKQGQLDLAESALLVRKSMSPEIAAEHTEIVDSAFKKAGRVKTQSHRSNGIHTLFAEEHGQSDAFFDPKEALDKRPLKRYLNPGRQRRKEALELGKAFSDH